MGILQGKWASSWMDQAFWPYISTLVRFMSWKVALALGLMVCLSLSNGVVLLMLVLLLQLVGLDVQQDTLGRVAQFLSSIFAAVGVHPTLIKVLGVYVLIVSFQGMLHRWQTTINLSLQHEFVASLRQRLYKAISNTDWAFLSRSRSSDFTHVLTTEMERVGELTYHLLRLFTTAMVAMVYILFALKLSVVITALAFASGGGLMLVLKGKTQVARAAGEGLSQTMKSLYATVTEHLGGIKTAKSYCAEDRHADIFARLTERAQHMYIRAVRNKADVQYWFDIGSVLILSLVLYVSIEVLAIPTAEVLLLLFLFSRVTPMFANMQLSYQRFVNLLPAFATVMEVQARCEAAAEPKAQKTEKVELRHATRFERVSFSYEDTPVTRDLDLTICAGETTAIVGPSGAGKSTIADLVMGLIIPNRGRVLVDGIPLSPERMRSWRDQIGYVAQDTFLFNDTVRANLLWAQPDATEEEIYQALRLAAAEEFVSKLPSGLDTVVGERGVLLSGGERQRLALARALLRKPSLLILDEATSALDSENEQRIRRAIGELHGYMTILIISHRLSTVRGADIVYVLEEGRLVESGPWDSLIAKENGRFRALCVAQGAHSEGR